ncbi:MAG: PD-(D/E)XK nuclease family protein [Myxococcaceae bacterium]
MARVLTNDFSWSKSRHEKLSECLRAYYLYYYASWGGWDREAPETARSLYVLKKLHNRYTWAGSVVHETIREALLHLQRKRDVDGNVFIERAHRQMQQDFRLSRNKIYWSERLRKQFNGLIEHEYNEPVPPDAWKQNWENVKQALSWFFQSRWVPLAKNLPRDQWLEVDETDFDRSIFQLDGVKVFAVPDFAYFNDAGTPVVVDWKTGKAREGYDDQVLGYALYLSSRYNLDAQKVQTSLVYLNDGVEQLVHVTPESLEKFRGHFRTSVEKMRQLLQDAGSNQPKEQDKFPMTESLHNCSRCVFRRACGREAVELGKVA